MNDKDLSKIIDEYYSARESGKTMDTPDSETSLVFSSLDKMDLLEENNVDLNVDILSIISDGEEIINTKNNHIELLLFMLCGTLFLLCFGLACIFIDTKIFIYVEIAAAILIPFILIPVSYIRTIGGEH